MAGRSRSDLEAIRSANRRALGMSGVPGLGDCGCKAAPSATQAAGLGAYTGQMAGAIPGMGFSPLSFLPTVKVGSAFPKVDYAWDPSQPSAPPQGESSAIGDWLNRHIFRPYVEAGPVRYSPGDGFEDYSDLARAATYAVATFGAAVGAWVLYRAFAPRSLA